MTKLISAIVAALLLGIGSVQAQDKPVVFAQLGHSSSINTLAFSPDGRLLASGGDNTIKLWDVASAREVRTLEADADRVNSVAFSPDGKLLASGGQDHTGRLWEVASGREVLTLVGHSEAVTSVAFSPDGKILATGSADNTVRLWDVTSGREIRTLSGHSASVNAVAFSPDGKMLASGSSDETIRFWDADSGRTLRKLKSGQINSIAFSPNGGLLASGGENLKVTLWDVGSGRALHSLPMNPAADIIASVAFSPDGRLLAAGNAIGILNVWDVRTRRLVRAEDEGTGLDSAVAFSPDGKLLARATLNMTINLWDVATWRQVRVLQQYTRPIESVMFSPDGKLLGAATSNDGPVIFWSMGNARQIRVLGSDAASPNIIGFSSDGSTVAIGGRDGTVTLSDAASGRILRTLSFRSDAPAAALRAIDLIAFSPDGRTLASSWEAKVKLWDVATGREIATLSGRLDGRLVFSPDGKLLVWSDDKGVKFWDVAAGHEIGSLARPSLTPIAFLTDGKLLAFDSDKGTIKLVDAASGRDSRTIGRQADAVPIVATSVDGTMLAQADGSTVRLWDIATGRQLRALSHQYSVTTLAFSPDGRWLASGSYDGTINVWDMSSGDEKVSLITFTDGSWLAITPEGYYDASSAAAEEHLNVRVGDRVFGIASYRDKFFRPDLVKLSLAGQSLRDLRFAGIDSVKLAPVVELTDLPATTTNPALTVSVRITDGGGGIGAVRLYLNGTAIVQENAPPAPAAGAATTRQYTLHLLGGVNELRAVVFNADGSMQSNPATAKVVANLPVAPRGTLHAIVVGIQDFKNAKYNLSFSVADAELFAQTLREHSAPLFEHTSIKLLTSPADTTRESVMRALKESLADVGVNDVFVFYAASHGVIDDDGAYYLITSNVDSAEALQDEALSQADLTSLLANIPAPKKLVVMDTCHAQPVGDTLGEALRTRGLTASAAAKIAARDIGLTVLAASTSDEEALEGYNKHGLFTYVVSDGLAGSADLAKRGIITNDALTLFVRDSLPSLAANLYRHEQHPTVETNGAAFAVAKGK